MLFQCKSFLYINYINHILNAFLRRKETLSPLIKIKTFPPTYKNENRRRAFFFAPLKAGMTVEASMAVPVFLFCMLALIQFGNVLGMSVRYGSALCETGEKMAVLAYASENGEKTNTVLTGGLSAVYARSSVLGKAGKSEAVKHTSFLLSSFLKENDMIHLVMTYQVKLPVGGISFPGIVFLQRASVRGWTGRSGSEGTAQQENGTEGIQTVFVTEHGTVYHTDLTCTHIKLSIHQVEKSELKSLRNSGGEIYHSCEKCGSRAGTAVYITEDGNRYHASLECSGLKRTVREVSLEEAGNLRPCSKCGR